MVRDALQGLKNPWTQLFDPDRKSLSGSWNYLKENADYPYYLLKGFASSSSVDTTPNVDNGHGKILMLGGKRVAVYRDDGGLLHRLSPICPHLGCLVEWNPADQTWDCPCHGSRFQGNGKIFAGPAEKDLDPLS